MSRDSKKVSGKAASAAASSAGVRRLLGELEAEVMEVLWRQSPASVRDVHQQLAARRDIAYTTVMTVMSRLAEKGLLEREQRGRAYLYTPTRSRDRFGAEAVLQVMKDFWGGYREPALSGFVDAISDEDAARLDELARLIEARRKGGR